MNRNYTLDYLRGLAALTVCLCHFRHCLPEPFSGIAAKGHVGVQVFFVISGYVVPLSMAIGGYHIRDIVTFWLKRITRLQPPFLVALVITFAVSAAAAHVQGRGLPFSYWDVIKAAFYLWIPSENPVIWTLVVELKYYLLMGFLFPLMFSTNPWLRRSVFLAAAGCAGLFDFRDYQFIPYFLMGFAVAYGHLKLTSRAEGIVLGLLAGLVACYSSSFAEVAAGIATFALLALVAAPRWIPGYAIGEITYSLYLLHFPIGVKLINLLLPSTSEVLRPLLLLPALLISCGVAVILFHLVERPAIALSKRFKYARFSSSSKVQSLVVSD